MKPAFVKRNFSRYAHCYDRYAQVQNRCAERLIALVRGKAVDRIVDVGCGTGTYTARLRAEFPHADITAVDISPEMIAMARARLPDSGVEFIVADARNLCFEKTVDLITSNAAFQWLEDLEPVLRQYKGMLNENGRVVFSLFGADTFQELSTVLSLAYGKDVPLSSRSFFPRRCLQELMRRVFSACQIQEEIMPEEFSGVRDLLNTIKYSGTAGQGILRKGLLTPRFIDRLETVYRREFGGVVATYHILFCEGKS